jgi:hypothetical protein
VRSDLAKRVCGAIALLLVASCSGGGCSSGCAACGSQPLPGGFPKVYTIPNAASVRVTRPGLDFLQANLGTIGLKALGTSAVGGVASFPIPKSSASGADICPDAAPAAPKCTAEIDVGNAKLRIDAVTPNHVLLDGLLPVRIRDLPVVFFGFGSGHVVAGDTSKVSGGDLCGGVPRDSDTMPFKEFPLTVDLPLVTETRLPRDGYTKVDIANATINIGITSGDVDICDDTCGGFCQPFFSGVKDAAFSLLVGGIQDQIKSALGDAFCTKPTPTVSPPCPDGSQPDNADLTKANNCVFISNTSECVPALLGADGRIDLGKALAAFSPGTQGGLDFVLASAGDMSPDPKTPGVPSWTPRKPPVPAQDNNNNGISLAMLGGAEPHPTTNCVKTVDESPPQGIPVPKELTDDSSGAHLGFAIAGRYLSHAMTSAYNSGALCLGVSTDSVGQLNSGFLSLIAPSIKNLTFEGNSAAAAITTRPGAPPKVAVGTSPLLTITLPQFGIDFYVWSQDRFVRVFTYTADVSVPVDLQTGKDPKTNPNGGILPVLGNLGIANGALTNADLLGDDPGVVGAALSGLLSSVVGQFLGGGFSPIDLSSALAAAGLGIDIPAGGIHKITSGSDDFVGLFANLTLAPGSAHEEADTRATLIEKIVDASAMSLATADRARFPKLRVHAEGVASKPTEQTWWIDDGPHARWTTSQDLLVDSDVMILQGKHVLHVSSRIVNDTPSEDATPAAIPFTIDTLPPDVELVTDGNIVHVKAWDFVSPVDALLARIDDGAWTRLADLPPLDAHGDATVEVKDEEGNVGRVQQGLIRGRADSSLTAAGSGCGSCSTSSSHDLSGTLALLALVALSRRKSRSRA